MRHRVREIPKIPKFKPGWWLFLCGLGILLWYLAAPLPPVFAHAVTAPVSIGSTGGSKKQINPNLTHLRNSFMEGKRGAILEGSSRSGKTWSSVDFIILLCVSAKEPITINIIKETYKSFKTTLYDDFNRRMPAFGLVSPFANRQEVASFKLFGSKINLLGADSDSVMHGVSCDYLYMNEMLDIPQSVFDQLEMRCRKFWWGDYNPKFTKHWVYDKVCHRPDVAFLKTTFLDNPGISPAERNKILSYEPTNPEDRTKPEAERRPHPTNIANGTADDYMWNVYGLGVRSAPEGLVFQHVTWIDKFPTNIEHVYYGSDIGYTNSPSTLVRVGRDGQNLYLELLHYGPTPSSNEYIPILRKHNPNGTTWSDSAEPGYIMDSRRAGLKVMAVNKFPGSINYGISLLKKFKIHIVDCEEFREEQGNYKYREINGIKLDEPIDDFNHCFTGNTLITTNHGNVPIEYIERGDMVLTSEGYNTVMEKFYNGVKTVKNYDITHANGHVSVRCTQYHKVKTTYGMLQISSLVKGDMIYLNGVTDPVEILNIDSHSKGFEPVYDLAVQNTHEYFANGLLVSNCWDAARYAVMSNLR